MEEKEYPPFNLDIVKQGHFILVKHDKGLFGDLINKKQLAAGFTKEHSLMTHVEVSGGGPWSVRIAPPLTTAIDITKTYAGREIIITKYKADDYNKKRYKVAWWSATLCNLPYDKGGVAQFSSAVQWLKKKFGFLFRWLRNSNRLYFCSEGALSALQKVYPKAVGIRPEDCMPAQFLVPKSFEIIWRGKLPDA